MNEFEIDSIIVPSASDPLKFYAVGIFENGSAVCTCISYKMRGSCKHLKQAAEQRAARTYAAPALQRLQQQASELSRLSAQFNAKDLETAQALWLRVEAMDVLISNLKQLEKK